MYIFMHLVKVQLNKIIQRFKAYILNFLDMLGNSIWVWNYTVYGFPLVVHYGQTWILCC